MIEKVLLTLVVVLLVILVILMVAAVWLLVRMLKKKGDSPQTTEPVLGEVQKTDDPEHRYHPEIRKRLAEARAQSIIEANCAIHNKEPSEGSCGICHKYFCKSCLKTHQSLVFCKEHYGIFLNAQWSEVFSIRSTARDPEIGVRLIDFKKSVWEKEQIPLYTETHYKIDVDHDEVESWVVLFSREDDVTEIKKQLDSFQNPAALQH